MIVSSGSWHAIAASFQSASSGVSSIAWINGRPTSPMRSRYCTTHWLSSDTPWKRVWKLDRDESELVAAAVDLVERVAPSPAARRCRTRPGTGRA